MLEPFLPMVKLFELKKFLLSIKCTSSPTDGEAGKFTVTVDALVSTNTWSLATVVYVPVVVIYPFFIRLSTTL